MAETLFAIAMFIVALLILITFHELGHFWVARWCGVKVLRFSVGFGKPFYRWLDKRGTEFVLAQIPLGGYVKMLEEAEGPVAADERHLTFNAQPIHRRMLIVAAGPMFNFILAVFLFWLMLVIGFKSLAPVIGEISPQSIAAQAQLKPGAEIIKINDTAIHNWRDFQLAMMTRVGDSRVAWTVRESALTKVYQLDLSQWQVNQQRGDLLKSLGVTPYVPPISLTVGQVIPHSPAAVAGFKPGDTVVKVADQTLHDWRDFVQIVRDNPNKSLKITIEREQVPTTFILIPEAKLLANGEVIGSIGLQSQPMAWPKELIRHERYGVLSAVLPALGETWRMTCATFKLIWKLLVGDVSLRTLSGPIGIAQGAGQTASIGFAYYLGFLAMISISLGVLNILPIPLLDGGHLLYDIIELIRGRAVSLRTRERAARGGIVALLMLMSVALFNDLQRLFG